MVCKVETKYERSSAQRTIKYLKLNHLCGGSKERNVAKNSTAESQPVASTRMPTQEFNYTIPPKMGARAECVCERVCILTVCLKVKRCRGIHQYQNSNSGRKYECWLLVYSLVRMVDSVSMNIIVVVLVLVIIAACFFSPFFCCRYRFEIVESFCCSFTITENERNSIKNCFYGLCIF